MTQTEYLIIGAGPAGLAAAAVLTKCQKDFVLLEKESEIASSWKNHYDRVHLHTPKSSSHLPYSKFPRSYPRYPSKNQFIEYLEGYAKKFDIIPNLEQTVQNIHEQNGKWIVETDKQKFLSSNLIVAAGMNHIPYLPEPSIFENFSRKKIHSRDYKSPNEFFEQKVLVVGMGNSGSEIALDLAENGIDVAISTNKPINIFPRDTMGISSVTLSIWMKHLPAKWVDASSKLLHRSKFKKLADKGLNFRDEGPRTQVENTGKTPVIDIGTAQLIIDDIIKVYPKISNTIGSLVKFESNEEQLFDAIIFATGYKPALEFLPANIHEHLGKPT